VCLVRFMVESPAQSGRMRTLIHPGPTSGVHVTLTAGIEVEQRDSAGITTPSPRAKP